MSVRALSRLQQLSDTSVAFLCAATAALFRIPYLTSKSFWMDEGFSVVMARSDPSVVWNFVRNGELNMLLYYTLLRAWVHVSISEFWIRLLSALCSIAAVAFLYLVAVRLLDRRTALFAAALMCVHPADVTYAQEARSYSLTVLLVTMSFLFLVRLEQRGERPDAVGYVVATSLAAYTHFVALFVIVPQVGYFVSARRQRWWQFAGLLVVVLVLVAPIGVFMLRSGHGLIQWTQRPTIHDALDVLTTVTLPGWRALVYVLLWGVVLVGGIRGRLCRGRSGVALVALWLLGPVALALAISLVKPMFVARFFVVCVPAAVLLAALGITQLRPRMQAAVVILTVLVSFNATLAYYRHPQWKEDWRGVTRYVAANAEENDAVIVEPAYARFTVDYYRNLYAPAQHLLAVDLPASGTADTPVSSAVWLVVRGANGTNEVARDALARSGLMNRPGYCLAETHQFNLIELWRFSPCP